MLVHQELGLTIYVNTKSLSPRKLMEPIETLAIIFNNSPSSFGFGVSQEALSVQEEKMNTPSLVGRLLAMFIDKKYKNYQFVM